MTNEFIAQNWPLLAIGALIALVVLWWIVLATRKTRVRVDRRDTLDEGAAPAARNQVLIDAPSAAVRDAAVSVAAPEALGGAGVAVAAAVEDGLAAARHPVDDLLRIKGLGPKLALALQDLGVTSIDQIAAWKDADIDRIDAQLGRFEGRIRRDRWVEQAKLLAAGDQKGFEARFGAQ